MATTTGDDDDARRRVYERPRTRGKRGARTAREGDARRVRGAGSRVDVLFLNVMSREGETRDARARRGFRLTAGARDGDDDDERRRRNECPRDARRRGIGDLVVFFRCKIVIW